jgi:outer membrane protein OmpA-like peptidoglycan-associated protein
MRLRERAPAALLLASVLTSACAADPAPTRDLALRRVVLYQNGIGYFERSGALREDRLKLRLRSHEIDDVLKTLVVIEGGASKNNASKPSTVTVLLPSSAPRPAEGEEPEPTWLDVVLSPRPTRELSIAYAVPTAAWKAAYRVVLPDREKGAPKAAGGSALLQAWALIDNVSDEDWVGINLTLATGAPMSFQTDLRSPRFIKRPGASYDFGEAAPTGPVYAERVAQVDQDADGIIDSTDACPNERGAPNADPTKSGCPQLARVIMSSSEIKILHVIQFDRDSSQVKPASFVILDQVAHVLRENPQIRALTIEGHASSGEKDPWGLSAKRAAEVKKRLVERGVATELKTASTGETKPIASNATDDGRARNRRVEFHIERTEADDDRKVPAGRATAGALSQTAPAQTAIRDLAGSVRYDITHPVTIPKSSTTLVTIINEYIPGEEIFFFRPDPSMPGSHRHPMRAARIENKSGFGLQAGPVAVFGGGTFVGEGVLGKLNPGDTAMIPYGIDSSTTVEVAAKETSRPVRLIALARGQMTVEDSRIVTTSYSIAAGLQTPARIFLRHGRGAGFTATDLPPETETTPDAYILPIPIQERRSSTLAIEERKPERHVLDILATDGERLAAYLHNSRLHPDVEKRVREVVELRNEVGRFTRDISTIRTQLNDLGQQSSELRENLQAIEKTPRANALQQRLLDRLGAATKQMDELSAKLSTATVDLAEARARLAESLRDFRIEEPSEDAGEKTRKSEAKDQATAAP